MHLHYPLLGASDKRSPIGLSEQLAQSPTLFTKVFFPHTQELSTKTKGEKHERQLVFCGPLQDKHVESQIPQGDNSLIQY